MQFAVLLTHVVEHAGEEVERRVDAELVEEGVIAIVVSSITKFMQKAIVEFFPKII